MKSLYYFAYGSNIDEYQMSSRCPFSMKMYKGILKDYRLVSAHYSKTWKGGVFSVIEQEGFIVEGIIYEITLEDMESLDRYEGFPNVYRKEDCEVFVPILNKNVECFIYKSNHNDIIDISDDYLYHCTEAAIKEGINIHY